VENDFGLTHYVHKQKIFTYSEFHCAVLSKEAVEIFEISYSETHKFFIIIVGPIRTFNFGGLHSHISSVESFF